MSYDNIEFDLDIMMDALKNSTTYDEFRMKCDLDNNECIITHEEYDHIRGFYFTSWLSHQNVPISQMNYLNISTSRINL